MLFTRRAVLLICLIALYIYSVSQTSGLNINCSGLKSMEEISLLSENKKNTYKDVKRARLFNINPALKNIETVNLNDSLILELFDDKKYVAVIDKINIDINSVLKIRARTPDFPMGYTIITSDSNGFLMQVVIPELNEQYGLKFNNNEQHPYLVKYNKKYMDILPSSGPLYPPELEYDNNENNGGNTGNNSNSNKNSTVIDIMIVYTPDAKQWADSNNSGINNSIAQSIANSNLTLDNSNVGASINLVYSSEVDYTEAGAGEGGSEADLKRITTDDDNFDQWGETGYMNEVHEWRDDYGADLVVFFTKVEDTGGLAWQLEYRIGWSEIGFSITRIQQAHFSYTMIHEIGHNMGCHHHAEQNFQAGPTDWFDWGANTWSAGWKWQGDDAGYYCSVMSYGHNSFYDDDNNNYTRVPYFSNPEVFHQGQPTGDVNDGNNALTIIEMKEVIAAYRPSAVIVPSPELTTNPIQDITQTTATSGGNITNDGGGIISQKGVVWSIDENPTIDINIGFTEDGDGTDEFTSNITDLLPGTNYFVRAYAINEGGIGYGNSIEFTTLVDDNTVIWTGYTNKNWDTPSNWLGSSVPEANKNVIIPNHCSNYPDITGFTEIEQVTIESDANISISCSGELTINSDLINNGTVIISSCSGTDGSLLTNNDIQGTGTFIVERYISGGQWHLVSSLTKNSLSGVFEGLWLRPYDEAINDFGNFIENTSHPLTKGKGYVIWANSNTNISFTGEVYNGNIGPINLQLTGDAGGNSGWNLIGNPYPSTIDWESGLGWTKNNIANSVHIWNNGQYAAYINGVGTHGGSRYIAKGQGFFVRALDNNADISMNNNVRTHEDIDFKENSQTKEYIRVVVQGSKYSDELVFYLEEFANKSSNHLYDAAKIKGLPEAPTIYAKKNEEKISIYSTNNFKNICGNTIFLESIFDNNLTISFYSTIESKQDNTIYIYDKKYGTKIKENKEYEFTYDIDTDKDRFILLTNSLNLEEHKNNELNVWVKQGNILKYEYPENQELIRVKLHSINGSLIYDNFNSGINLNHLSKGIYLVSIKTNKSIKTKKILLK